MNRHMLRRIFAAGAAAATLAVVATTGVAAAAGVAATAATGETWAQVDAKLTTALNDRVATLASLTASVADNAYLSTGDRQGLTSRLGPETAGINQLAAEVAAATPTNTTIAQLRSDAQTMVDQYRVYLVMSRQVHLTEAADTQTALETRLSGLEPQIQAAIAAAGNPPAALAAYHDLLTQVGDAATATGRADVPAVLAVTAPGYPNDATALVTAGADLHNGLNDLQSARTDIRIIRNAIQQTKPTTANS